MYVINLIVEGDLKRTSVKEHETDAMTLGRNWSKELKGSEGYVAIDKKVKKGGECVRHSELTFNEEKTKVQIKLEEVSTTTGGYTIPPILKSYGIAFLELALQSLLEFLKNQNAVKK